MKTFTPIAMRCTEEQFKAIEPKLKGFNIVEIGSFEIDNYLINDYGNKNYKITNICEDAKRNHNRKVYEEWNEEIFLNACGIEQTYTLTKEQLTYLHSVDSIKETIEEWFPNEFLKPIEVTLEEIAKLKGCNVEQLRIKE